MPSRSFSYKVIFVRYICLLFSIGVLSGNHEYPEVKTEQGVLTGRYRQTWNGGIFNSFTGIPYAQEITSLLKTSKDQLLPVMFYIHWGGFFSGSGNADFYGPDILLDKDVVLVTFNYRLGALGFLSTKDEFLPGNNGLKDQNLALKWVKKNIVYFGGSPDKITVLGQSVGGASTHYHVLSPLSRDLISRAIAHSGIATAVWALAPKGEALTNAKRLAGFLNCPDESDKEMIDCLNKVDAFDIVTQEKKFLVHNYDPVIRFKPVIEPDIDGAFLTEDPIDIIRSSKSAEIPFITGITTEDGALKSAGVCYGDELFSLFSTKFFPDYKPSESEKKCIDVLSNIWTSFALTGNPTPTTDSLIKTKWEPAQKDVLSSYFFNGIDDIKITKDMYKERIDFWKNILIASQSSKIKDEF
ncbi:hypothetical protein ILUMI_03535 [Ignelater luminosus]|uniref:Carboxylesterase type B domain-containing protein n=1 Tax=Ignelater luminosus TaxID=2038154 RepID=A0A8K0DLK9_IGNLU|nr:hypothetical protein ILUMI_03535 [Ignelater luminosus]